MGDRVRPFRRARRWLLPQWHYDTRPILVGVAVTAVFTVCFHFGALLFPTESLRMWLFHRTGTYYRFDNPLGGIEFLGGIVGGAVAGRRTTSAWIDAGVNGLFAGVLGIVAVWVVWAGVRLLKAVFVWQMVPPFLEVFVIPMIFLLPLLLFNLLLGFVGGVAGYFVR